LESTLSFLGTGNDQDPVGGLATSSQRRYEPSLQQHKIPIKLSTGGIKLSGVRPPALARRNSNKDINSHGLSCNNPHDSRRKSRPFHNHNHHHRSTSPDNSVDSHYSRRHLHKDSDNFNMAPAKKASQKKRKAAPAEGSSSKSRKSRGNDENQAPIRSTRSKKLVQPEVEEDQYDDDATVPPTLQEANDNVEVPPNRRAKHSSRVESASDEDNNEEDDVEESDEDEVEVDNDLPGKPPGMSNERYIRFLQRKAKAHEQNMQQAQAQHLAIERAAATKRIQNKENLKKIEECVKTKVWHTCKFITNNSTHEKATIYVLNNLDEKPSPEQMADDVLTYKGPVGKYLNDKRNYCQSQMREVVMDFALHKVDPLGRRVTGRDRVRDESQPADTPPNQIRMVMRKPLVLFRMGLIEKAITR
jgi:hypothetical protein